MNKLSPTFRTFAAGLLAALFLAGCGAKNKNQARGADTSAEPDKVLYERAMDDIKHGKQIVARFTLQTLINTYPDSEYLAKAKLAIADSFFKEGDTAGLKQAISEYKDFGTFFPYLDEAGYAQMQVGMAHYRMMEKPDRDRSEAQFAEQEFQTFLLKYPQHKLAGQAEQRLRDVQEVLAEGDFRIAQFYFRKNSMRASSARLTEIVDRYPLYSRADDALWMLGQAYQRYEKTEYAGRYYNRLVRDYPLSPRVEAAKKELIKLGVPVPQPNPEALARMQKEKEFDKQRPGLFHRSLGILKSGPNVSTAAHTGSPNLAPEGESGTETLRPGGQVAIVATTGGATTGSSTPVQTVTAGGSTSTGSTEGQGGTDNTSTTDSSTATPQTDGSEQLPNHDEPAARKRAQAKEKESSSKKKKGLRRLVPF